MYIYTLLAMVTVQVNKRTCIHVATLKVEQSINTLQANIVAHGSHKPIGIYMRVLILARR